MSFFCHEYNYDTAPEAVLFPVYFIIYGENFLRRLCCHKGNDNVYQCRQKESRQQFIDCKNAAQSGNAVLPDEDHSAAGDHAAECAPFIRTLPEQGT